MSENKIKKSLTIKDKLKTKSTCSDDESVSSKPIKIGKFEKKNTMFMQENRDRNIYFDKINNAGHETDSTDFLGSPMKNQNRKDFKGIPITRGKNKKQHITFRDYTGKVNLVDYVDIQSFKNLPEPRKRKDDDNTSCTCSIF
jgi:hypothetical protein